MIVDKANAALALLAHFSERGLHWNVDSSVHGLDRNRDFICTSSITNSDPVDKKFSAWHSKKLSPCMEIPLLNMVLKKLSSCVEKPLLSKFELLILK